MDTSPRPTAAGPTVRTIALPLVFAALAAGFLAGCEGTGKAAIAPGADEVESGRGLLDYEAQRDGEVFVYDAETDKMVFRGDIEDGQEVQVDPERNKITVGGKTVSEQPLIRDHKYRIYFKRR
jgi:hypothetical protein